MRFREGTTGQKALFAALVGTYLFSVALAINWAVTHVGQPNTGLSWLFYVVDPTRADVLEAGMPWGSRILSLNGVEVAQLNGGDGGADWDQYDILALERRELGAINHLTIRRPDGTVADLSVPVRTYTWGDAFYHLGWYSGMSGAVFVIGVAAFILRPYEPSSWGLLAPCAIGAGSMTAALCAVWDAPKVAAIFFSVTQGISTFGPVHTGLAFPTVHPLLIRRPRTVFAIYAAGLPVAGLLLWSWAPHPPAASLSPLLVFLGAQAVAMGCVMVRVLFLALRGPDRLTRQRGRIFAIVFVVGFGGFRAIEILCLTLDLPVPDARLMLVPLLFTVLALAYLILRYDLVEARIAIRRGVAYGAGALALVVAAFLIVRGADAVLVAAEITGADWLGPGLAAFLLVPVALLWPRYTARVNASLYPRRAQFSGLHRAIGDELAASATREAVVDVLAAAPLRVCETDSGAAFLLPGAAGDRERVSGAGDTDVSDVHALADEPLIHLLVGSRQTIKRESLGVDPQFTLIKDAARACMDALNAAVLLPIERDGRVIGGLAVGPHVRGDVYDPAELELLRDLAHDAVHALATAELREQSAPGGRPRTPTASAFSPGVGDSLAFSESASGYVLPAIAGERYEVRGLLGEGGFKRVYLAHDAMLNRDVALAVIRAHRLDDEGRTRVRREAQAMAQLGDHPHLVTVYDMGETADELYIVSQYMPGGDLDSKLADAPGLRLPVAEAIHIGRDLCTALAEAHGHGILHRDLKPGNVWLSADGRAALGDFGLALSVDQSRITQSGYLVGTLAYTAPELFHGAAPSVQSDLYALGVLLYEMVAGRRPYEAGSTAAMIHEHLRTTPAAPSSHNPDIPAALDALILQLLAKDPADRYPDAPAVHAALAEVAG